MRAPRCHMLSSSNVSALLCTAVLLTRASSSFQPQDLQQMLPDVDSMRT